MPHFKKLYRWSYCAASLNELQINNTCNVRNSDARSVDHLCPGKAISVSYSECVFVALVVQYAKSMRRVVFQSATCLAVPYFSHIIS